MKRMWSWLYVGLMLVLVTGLLACESSGGDISFSDGDTQTDGDVETDGDDAIESLDLEGGSTGEGNPEAHVAIGFVRVDRKNAVNHSVNWTRITLEVAGVFLAQGESCSLTDGAAFETPGGSIPVIMGDTTAVWMKMKVPADTNYCSLDLRLSDSGTAIKMEGETADGDAVHIHLSLLDVLRLVPESGMLSWADGESWNLLAALDTGAVFDSAWLSQLQAEEDGVLWIDESRNADKLHDAQKRFANAMHLIVDENADGQVGEEEEAEEPIAGGASDPMAGVPIDCRPPPMPNAMVSPESSEPQPLDVASLFACPEEGDSCGPYQYLWQLAPYSTGFGDPRVMLIKQSDSFDSAESILNKWTDECNPKVYFPIVGSYYFRVYIRNAYGVESGPTEECPTCAAWHEFVVHVRPDEQLVVELIWEKGDNTDLDLFLVRKRDDGTFAVMGGYTDRVNPEPGSELEYVPCSSGNACEEGYCTPGPVGLGEEWTTYCTNHSDAARNDTLFYGSSSPRWGEMEALQVWCTDNGDCNGPNMDEIAFMCVDTACDFSCEDTLDCLTYSNQAVCGESYVCEGNDLDDDPVLHIDDVDGWGPEMLSIKNPSPGVYRIVTRFYADPEQVVSDSTPDSELKAHINIYVNGDEEPTKHYMMRLTEPMTYWKVADIVWSDTDGLGDAEILPICAGYTATQCSLNADCREKYADYYTCKTRNFGRFCSNCTGEIGDPASCRSAKPCTGSEECANLPETPNCIEIAADYCHCDGVESGARFEDAPYANPFVNIGHSIFDPTDQVEPRSIWCDEPTDMVNLSQTCDALYGP